MICVLSAVALIGTICFFAVTAYAFTPGTTESDKSDWKTFKDRENLFTIEYPSDWIPYYTKEADKVGPIDIYISSPGSTDTRWAEVDIYLVGSKSAFGSAQESVESEISINQNDPSLTKFEIERPVECSAYTLNGIQACSYIYEVKSKTGGHNAVLVVDALLDDGTEYEALYRADVNSFKKYLSVGEEMILSFKTTDNNSVDSGILSGNDTAQGLNITNETSSNDPDFSID